MTKKFIKTKKQRGSVKFVEVDKYSYRPRVRSIKSVASSCQSNTLQVRDFNVFEWVQLFEVYRLTRQIRFNSPCMNSQYLLEIRKGMQF